MNAVSSRSRRQALNKGFARVVFFSLLVHAGLLGGVVYGQYAKGHTVREFNSIPVELVKLGKPRDPNLLPRITKPAFAPPPPDEGVALDSNSKTNPKTKDEAKSKDPQLSDAAKRLLEQRPDALDKALDHIEEDEGAEDGSIYGTTTDPTRGAKGYEAQVSAVLHQAYKLPATIAESERRFLTADVILYIEADGTISKFEFAKRHPNEAFMRALELMLQSVKLPPPPKEMQEQYRSDGIPVRFKPT